ncbi:Putative fluoride ion transporter CrcB [Grimontia marina]|uniref:Fluoride-specific ion channel FluC n=2 Tax=Grimontia marina TaxID=646534 RepID=A0A128F618_9GAMM|nr:Putative fluoride ion transporter CrcB [Grimontia marina]
MGLNAMNQAALLFYIAIGGAFGACSRYLISELCAVMLGRGFPYGTLMVNVVGSFMMGLLVAALEQEVFSPGPWRHLIGLGFLGALTTFSTFSMDNVLLLQQGEWFKMGLNVVLNVVVCIFAAWAGFQLLMRG